MNKITSQTENIKNQFKSFDKIRKQVVLLIILFSTINRNTPSINHSLQLTTPNHRITPYTMITRQRRKQSRTRSHLKAHYDSQQQNLLAQTHILLQTLFDIRLIEKLSRPLSKPTKQQLINIYGQKLQTLHTKLARIRTQIVQFNTLSQNGNEKRNKSVFGEATSKPDDWKKIIRGIEHKYTEKTLVDGSFKYYKKVVLMLGLVSRFSMELINIEEWSAACLDNRSNGNCC